MQLADLTLTELRTRLRGDGVRLRTGPFVVRLQSKLASLPAQLTQLYGDFPVLDEGFADFHVRLDRPTGLRRYVRPQVCLWLDGRRKFDPFPVELGLALLEWGLNWCVFTHANQSLLIHAGAVEKGGRVAILPAPPGSGKSTLTAGLIHRGWRLMSDEITMVDPGSGEIHALARPVSLKEGSIDVIRGFEREARFGPVFADTRKGTVCHMRPPTESVRNVDKPGTPTWVIFPRYEPGAEPVLTELSRSHALTTLIDSAFNYNVLGPTGFETMADLLERCEVLQFTYSDLNDAVKTFDALADAAAGQGSDPVTQAALQESP